MNVERQLDPEALGDHIDRLYRAAWSLCGSREEAEDLVQETFERVTEVIGESRDRGVQLGRLDARFDRWRVPVLDQIDVVGERRRLWAPPGRPTLAEKRVAEHAQQITEVVL